MRCCPAPDLPLKSQSAAVRFGITPAIIEAVFTQLLPTKKSLNYFPFVSAQWNYHAVRPMVHNGGTEVRIQRQMPQTLPNSLTESGREAKHEAPDNGMLWGWWQNAIGDVRDLLGAAKHGKDAVTNLELACAILEPLLLIAQDRVCYACSCEHSKALEQALVRLSNNLYIAMTYILLAVAVARSVWGRTNPLTGQITSALRRVPTLAEVDNLAPDLGCFAVKDGLGNPMVKQDATRACRFCGQSISRRDLDLGPVISRDHEQASEGSSTSDLYQGRLGTRAPPHSAFWRLARRSRHHTFRDNDFTLRDNKEKIMTDYTGQKDLALNFTGATTSDIEYVQRVLHSVMVSERMRGWDAYRDGIDEPLQRPERVIARDNREVGWATIPLVGNEEEDVLTYAEGGDFDVRQWSFCYAARPLLGPRRRVGEPNPRVRLDRGGLELVLLARHLIHDAGLEIMDSMTGIVPREWALAQAQFLLTADRVSALCLLADSVGFRGTRTQKLKQLDWLLDGQEPGIVVCRHCLQAVDPSDLFLTMDIECESDRHCREHDTLPRYSAHFMCYTAHSEGEPSKYDCYWFEPGECDRFWVDYPASSWITVEKYRLRWAMKEWRMGEVHRRTLAAEAVVLTGRAQAAKWALLSSHQDERDENSNDLVLSLAVAGASVRLEIKADKQYAVVSFWSAETYPGHGAGFSDTEIPTAVLWRSIKAQARTEVFGWASPPSHSDPDSYYEAATVILTFAVKGDQVQITLDSRLANDQRSITVPLATLRAEFGQHD